MNRSAYVLGLAVLAIATTVLHADPVDPVFSMGDPTAGTPVSTSSFAFGADAAGGGILAFVNQSGILWNDLTIKVTEPNNTAITILPGLFFNTFQFSSSDQGDGTSVYTIGLFNTGAGSGGIGNGAFFTINLNDLLGNQQNPDPAGAGGWGAGADFTAIANVLPGDPNNNSPEPASMLLVVAGLGLVGWGSRRSGHSKV
jgi:hypothetical protein